MYKTFNVQMKQLQKENDELKAQIDKLKQKMPPIFDLTKDDEYKTVIKIKEEPNNENENITLKFEEQINKEEDSVTCLESVKSLEEESVASLEEEEEEEEEESVADEEESDDKSVETETKEEEVVASLEEEEEEEVVASLEEEEEELFEIEIDDKTYCTNNEETGFIYELDSEGNVGDKIGYFKEGEPIFYSEE
jgi:hypothetical protein